MEEERKLSSQPLVGEEKLIASLRKAKTYLHECQDLSESLVTCPNSEKAEVTTQLDDRYKAVEGSLDLLETTLNQVKSDAFDEVNELKLKLKQTRKNKDWALEELEKVQSNAAELADAQKESVKGLEDRLNAMAVQHQFEQAEKDNILKFAELEQKTLIDRLKNLESSNQETVTRLQEKVADSEKDVEVYAQQLNAALQNVAAYAKAEMEWKMMKQEVKTIKVDKALSPIRVKIDNSNSQPNFYSDDSDEDEDHNQTTSSFKSCRSQKVTIATMDTDSNNDTSNNKIDRFVATPAKFGLPVWNEVEVTFLEHLMFCERGMKYAEEKKLKLSELQNLLLQTLPQDYQYVTAFLEDNDKKNMSSFKSKLMELIMGTNWDQSSAVLTAQRRSGEKILSFFLRLQNMYSFCTSKNDKELAEDKWFCMMLYQKILATLPLGAKAEFQRDCESSMVNGVLEFTDLKKKIITISRKASMLQPIGNQVSVLTGLNSTAASSEDKKVPSIATSAGRKAGERRSCYYCKKQGHIMKDCAALKKKKAKEAANKESNGRETKTDGRQPNNRKDQ